MRTYWELNSKFSLFVGDFVTSPAKLAEIHVGGLAGLKVFNHVDVQTTFQCCKLCIIITVNFSNMAREFGIVIAESASSLREHLQLECSFSSSVLISKGCFQNFNQFIQGGVSQAVGCSINVRDDLDKRVSFKMVHHIGKLIGKGVVGNFLTKADDPLL